MRAARVHLGAMTSALTMRGVAKRYRAGVRGCSVTVDVLRGAALDVAAGEVVGIAGGVAAGKSTLLLCAAGLLRPDAGTVEWFGVGQQSRTAPPGVVYVADRGAHYGFLTVREAVEYHATLHDSAGRDLSRLVDAALDRVALTRHAGRRVGALDRGALRRLALGQALVRVPRLLLLDETLTELDAETRLSLRGAVRALAREGVGVLIAARELDAMSSVADRVLMLERGVVRDAHEGVGAERVASPVRAAACSAMPWTPARVAEGGS